MASATSSASAAAWMFRALALGSSCAVAIHLYPILSSTPAPHAVALAQASEPFLARAGVSRIARQATRSSSSRHALVSAGALPVLAAAGRSADAGVRKAAGEAMVELMVEEEAVREGMRDEGVVEAMVGVEGEAAERLWRRVMEVEGGAEEVGRRGVCEQVKGRDVMKVLREGGAC